MRLILIPAVALRKPLLPRRLAVVTLVTEMKLSDVVTVKTNFLNAHFWLIRRGSISQCGKPVREYNPEHIGLRVFRTDILLPDYLFYSLLHIHQQGMWKPLANGSLALVNIKVSQVRNIELLPR